MMKKITPISKKSLPDSLAHEIRNYIRSQNYHQGDRLPPTAEIAKRFGVGIPTLREAIKKLETIGSMEVKHGSGLFVGKYFDRLFLPNPVMTDESLPKTKLIELIDARIAIEGRIIHLAIPNLTPENFTRLDQLLAEAKECPDDYFTCALKYLEIENLMRKAAQNTILYEIVMAITYLYSEDQINILNTHFPGQKDYDLHCDLVRSLKTGNEAGAVLAMETRFKTMRNIISQYMMD